MKEKLIELITRRLYEDAEAIRKDFDSRRQIDTRYTAVDNLLPDEIALQISEAFPPLSEMRFLDSFREKKYTSKSLDKFQPLVSDITFAFQDQRVMDAVLNITGQVNAVGDPLLYAGGISAMSKDNFLNPHIDNSHDFEQKNYRVLNLLYYCSPGWQVGFGGNLELWDENVSTAVEIPSLFNRLVLMETNDHSWHSVNRVRVNDIRRCVSNYYFSPDSPNGYETTHITTFKGRPDQKLNRIISAADGVVRSAVRRIAKRGLGRRDLFEKSDK
ncbi:MAG: 2OG-Fe(II) oxygenase [Acidobacteriota bacterium]